MASQIVTTTEKVGDVTRANFSGQRCDHEMRPPQKRAATKYTILQLHQSLGKLGEDQKIQ